MLKENAYAKINLFLNVLNKRVDGYHDLEMVMASVDLYDILSFESNIENSITVLCDKEITAKMEDNVVYKIAQHLKDTYNIEQGVTIHIKKNIPLAAGLAGGSADGAATLRGLNKFWKLNLALDDLAEIRSKFGSDIPFCIYNKLCVARGRGEELVFLDQKLNCPILLVNPNIEISTKEVFEKVQQEELTYRKISDMTSGIYNRNFELFSRELFNSLERVVFKLVPEVEEIKTQLKYWGIKASLMSGSGATVFGISKDKKKLKTAAATFSDDYFKILTKIR